MPVNQNLSRWLLIGSILWMASVSDSAGGESDLAHRLPAVVRDTVNVVEDFSGDLRDWRASPKVSLAAGWDDKRKLRIMVMQYSLHDRTAETYAEWTLPKLANGSQSKNQPPFGERLRFWFQGDGSENVLVISCFDTTQGKWTVQSQIPLDVRRWQHIEIPASNPGYYFYRTASALRFAIIRAKGAKATEGSIRMSPLEFVSPQALPIPLPPPTKFPASPVFTSWGGVDKQRIMAAGRAGVTLHSIPMPFGVDDHQQFARRAETAAQQMRWCHDAGMLAGLHFFNNPPEAWSKAHKDLFPMNSQGVPYCDYYPGGCVVSPWNPAAQKLWREHITGSLRLLQKQQTLRYVDAVLLSPGEEGELCFQWDHVWAFDQFAVAAYRAYLHHLYGNRIEDLNADWGTNYPSFEAISPPDKFFPDREHWVFQDFYRLSMLRWCVQLADAVREVFTPKYWYWLPHSLPAYPKRYCSARYPIYYVDNLRRLGLVDLVNLPALAWQSSDDIAYLRSLGVKIVGEIDVAPKVDRLRATFEYSLKYCYDGVYLGTLQNLFTADGATPTGEVCLPLMKAYSVR